MAEKASCNVLDFFYDDEDSCALTALINGVRFHIIVDAERLRQSDNEAFQIQYLERLKCVRSADAVADNVQADPECRDLSTAEAAIAPDEDSYSGWETSEDKKDRDSAIDLSADKSDHMKQPLGSEGLSDVANFELDLHNWILAAFKEESDDLAPRRKKPKTSSLHDWYKGITYFFEVDFEEGCLVSKQLEETAELRTRMEGLMPRMAMPKYIRDLPLPWVNARDVEVLSEVDIPGPIHPGTVRVGQETQFFKPVDSDQPQPTKREIQILHKVQNLGLHDQLKVPKLRGLVAFEDRPDEIMGLLLTNIVSPQPLTTLLDSDVLESRRLRWADETKDAVRLLNQHGII
jgi:hypothetical protein